MKESLTNLINKNNLIVISGKYGNLLTSMIAKSKKITGSNNIFLKGSDWQKRLFSSQQERSEQLELKKVNNPIFLDEIKLLGQRIFIAFPRWITNRERQLWIMIRDWEKLDIVANRVEDNYLSCWILAANSPFNNKFLEKKIIIPNDNSNRVLIEEINKRSSLKPSLILNKLVKLISLE
jgi:hypothetical protein